MEPGRSCSVTRRSPLLRARRHPARDLGNRSARRCGGSHCATRAWGRHVAWRLRDLSCLPERSQATSRWWCGRPSGSIGRVDAWRGSRMARRWRSTACTSPQRGRDRSVRPETRPRRLAGRRSGAPGPGGARARSASHSLIPQPGGHLTRVSVGSDSVGAAGSERVDDHGENVAETEHGFESRWGQGEEGGLGNPRDVATRFASQRIAAVRGGVSIPVL